MIKPLHLSFKFSVYSKKEKKKLNSTLTNSAENLTHLKHALQLYIALKRSTVGIQRMLERLYDANRILSAIFIR